MPQQTLCRLDSIGNYAVRVHEDKTHAELWRATPYSAVQKIISFGLSKIIVKTISKPRCSPTHSPRSLGKISDKSRRNLPPGIHPLVRTHPETGRRALFLNPVRMESIFGMKDKEALAFIDELMRHATQKNTNIATSGVMATG